MNYLMKIDLHRIATIAVLVFSAIFICSTAKAATYYYVDWTTADPTGGSASGIITLAGGGVVNVTFQAFNKTTNQPTGFYRAKLSSADPQPDPLWAAYPSTYTSTEVSNVPPLPDHLELTGDAGGNTKYVMSFSEPVINPIMTIFSLGSGIFGSNTAASYVFDYPFSILSAGPSIYGAGSFTASSTTRLDGLEGSGVIQFTGAVTQLEWTALTYEFWQGFTFGIKSAASDTAGVLLADLAATAAAPAAARVGESITVTGTCTNNGPDASAKAGCALSGLPAGATQTCTPAVPAALASGSAITCTSTFAPNAVGTLSITATSSDNGLSGGTADPSNSNNTETKTVSVSAEARMAAAWVVSSATATPGQAITATATCTNNGPSPATSPTCLVTGLPAGVLPSCTPAPLPTTLAVGQSISCTATFPAPPAVGPLTFTVTAGSALPNPAPAAAVASATVTVVGATGVITSVPVDSPWMLALAGVLMGCFAVRRMKGTRGQSH